MKQSALFKHGELQDENIEQIGYRLYLKFSDRTPAKATLYHNNTLVKIIELSDKVAKKLLVVEAVEMGAEKKALAAALGITAIGIYPPIRPMHPGRWAPIGIKATYIVKEDDCEDCREQGSCHCMAEISPGHVKEMLTDGSN